MSDIKFVEVTLSGYKTQVVRLPVSTVMNYPKSYIATRISVGDKMKDCSIVGETLRFTVNFTNAYIEQIVNYYHTGKYKLPDQSDKDLFYSVFEFWGFDIEDKVSVNFTGPQGDRGPVGLRGPMGHMGPPGKAIYKPLDCDKIGSCGPRGPEKPPGCPGHPRCFTSHD